MATTPYRVDRYLKDKNVLCTYSFDVTKAQRDRFSRFNLFSSKRRSLISAVSSIIGQDEALRSEERNRTINGFDEADKEVFELMDSIGYGGEARATMLRRKAFWYEERTLQLIIDVFGAGRFDGVVEWLYEYHLLGEPFLRESLTFYDVLKPLSTTASLNVVNDARQCGYPFEDLSELADEDVVLASAVMTVARDLLVAKSDGSSPSMMIQNMSFKLASVIVDYPERAVDIADYVLSRGLSPSEVSIDSLREYCSLPSRSLNSGVL